MTTSVPGTWLRFVPSRTAPRRRSPTSWVSASPAYRLSNGAKLDVVTLSTLRAYVHALGGSLRVVADFGDREYRLT